MASSDPEIKEGMTLPTWMKSKPTKEFEPFAGSPPAPEDSFFFIRYPKSEVLFGKSNESQEYKQTFPDSREVSAAPAYNIIKEKDWSKHTKPCQDVLHGIAPINTAVNSVTSKPKPAGTDDGFKGDGAACGTSIVKVAHQMITSSRSSRGFTVASPADDSPSEAPHYNHLARRGSKSLPVTPVHSPHSSPTSRRKMNANRYFTSPFEPMEDTHNRSWLSMALMGFKKDLTTSTSTLAEEDALEARLQGGSLAASVEQLGPGGGGGVGVGGGGVRAQPPGAPGPHHAAPRPRPRPTEFREINFWSPTSM